MKKLKLALMGLALLAGGQAMAQSTKAIPQSPKVIAHRGYWQAPGSAQNSIRALAKADSIGCYASEFDVWMTADSVLVVNHDATINGINIEQSDSRTIRAQHLANGECVPTLEEYLQAAAPLQVRLVCELKTHDSRATESLAAKETLKLVDKYGLADRTDYIAFSPEAYRQFAIEAPKQCGVYYLNGDYVPEQIKHSGGAGLDYSLRAMKAHPEWTAQAHDLGLLVNIWTVNDEADMRWCIEHGADFITTNAPELLQTLLKEYE